MQCGRHLALLPPTVCQLPSRLRTESGHPPSFSGSSLGADTTAGAKVLNDREYGVSFAQKYTPLTGESPPKESSLTRSFDLGQLCSSPAVFPKQLAAKLVASSLGG